MTTITTTTSQPQPPQRTTCLRHRCPVSPADYGSHRDVNLMFKHSRPRLHPPPDYDTGQGECRDVVSRDETKLVRTSQHCHSKKGKSSVSHLYSINTVQHTTSNLHVAPAPAWRQCRPHTVSTVGILRSPAKFKISQNFLFPDHSLLGDTGVQACTSTRLGEALHRDALRTAS